MRPPHVFLLVLVTLLGVLACSPGGSGLSSATSTVEPTPTPMATPTLIPTPTPTPASIPSPEPATSIPAPPCTDPNVSCEPRDLSGGPVGTSAHAAASGYNAPGVRTLEEVLIRGSGWREVHVDIVLRGTAQPETFRCEWHGYAHSNAQREAVLRDLLEWPASDPLPSQSEAERRLERRFASLWEYWPPDDIAEQKAHIDGGLVDDIDLRLYCFADYRVHEYILGDGPEVVTAVYYATLKYKAYSMYQQMQQHYRERAGRTYGEVYTQAEYQAELDRVAGEAVTLLTPVFGNRETVLLLAPVAASQLDRSIAVEGWGVLAMYDLQMAEDGTINAVAYGVPDGDPEQALTHANLKSRVTTAAASDAAAGERIANIGGLNQHYREMGAYEDITPHDGIDNPFTPAQPPPPCPRAVQDARSNPGLVADCVALLNARDTLRGTASLNWSPNTPITQWEGVAVYGDPRRVQALTLTNKGLDGSLSPSLGQLSALQTLRIRQNRLTGAIPAELAGMTSLWLIDLSRNMLTGSVPSQLGSLSNMRTIDLESNMLTGALPAELGDLPLLGYVNVASNQLTGSLPSELGGLSNLESIYLQGNRISGEIPSEWGMLSALRHLYLNGNSLTGCTPIDPADLERSDLAQLGLPLCPAPTPTPSEG